MQSVPSALFVAHYANNTAMNELGHGAGGWCGSVGGGFGLATRSKRNVAQDIEYIV